jgi:hypothetical protein
MKDYLENNFPEKLTYYQLRLAITEAWNKVPEDFLDDLIDSMPRCCQAIIDANGLSTKF